MRGIYMVTMTSLDAVDYVTGVYLSLEEAKASVADCMYPPDWIDINAEQGFWYSDPCGAVIKFKEAWT